MGQGGAEGGGGDAKMKRIYSIKAAMLQFYGAKMALKFIPSYYQFSRNGKKATQCLIKAEKMMEKSIRYFRTHPQEVVTFLIEHSQ